MKTICFFNQKGGVGKTTSVINIGAALGQRKQKVLIVDMDPQGNSTSGLGILKEELEASIYDVFIGNKTVEEIIHHTGEENVDLIPANSDLAGIEVELANTDNKEILLRENLNDLNQYDYILIDCPPSLGILSINGLSASDSVIIPLQCEYYALEGMSQLMDTIQLIRHSVHPNLEIEGILLTMYDRRNNLCRDVEYEVKKYFEDKVMIPPIPRNIRLAEAPSFGRSVLQHDRFSKGARAYKRIAKAIIQNTKDS
ncbi:MAG: AAA family ATPase [Tissierellia bacterium]|nr:AAA family ATPase [Tissierellia bacterium]